MNEVRIGLIGLGLLGSAVSARLSAAGVQVCGYDIDPARRKDLEASGGSWEASPNAMAKRCPFVILCLPTSETVWDICCQIQSDLNPGSLVLDATTGDPRSTLAVAALLRTRDVEYLDTTVVGSSQQVRQGQATILLGASIDAAKKADPILRAILPQIFHVGEVGSAAKMKLVVNLAIGLHRAVLAEALTLSKALGLDRRTALEVMKATSAYSRMMDSKGEKMLTGEFTPQARLAQHLKDVRLMLAAAAEAAMVLPLSQVNQQLLESAVEAGYGNLDNSAVIKAYEQLDQRFARSDAVGKPNTSDNS